MCQMCRCLNFAHPKRAKCVQCACKCCNQSLFPKSYENVCKSVNMQNFAHPHACKMCAVCLQICNWNLFAIKCGYAKFCTFTHVRNVCLFYHCFVDNCQNTGEPICLPYARHYNPRFVYFLPNFYIEVRFILQTTYGLKRKFFIF